MSDRVVDLRSDTVTRPSSGMREAMSKAVVGDDVLGDDPTVISLEKRMAALLGKEDAVYVPSGTMANLLGLLTQTSPGDEVILDRNSHIFNYEAGGASVIGGLQLHPLNGPEGFLPADELPGAVRPDNIHHPRSSLISVENTHNRGGGRIYPIDQLESVSRFARENRLRIHMDGARLANAVVATGISFEKYGRLADSINICFSKGLGAPVGSIMISDKETVKKGRYWRKRLGGGMRQSGILAQACHFALDNNIERLADDHLLASRIGAAVEKNPGLKLSFPVETNIVIFRVEDESIDFEDFTGKLERSGIRLLAFGDRKIRMVTHLDIKPEDIDYFEKVMASVL
ncbi:MAG: low-specificity L-threonine aldolase [Candidatus Krumholzibacteriota bacterium]|nr:low-specificity L-threonine aldolase [Candidatus Krumholzibacteriota bacterium]